MTYKLSIDRIVLLIHIIRKLGKYDITPDKLREVAHDAKKQLKPLERFEILDEILRVRIFENSTRVAKLVSEYSPRPLSMRESDEFPDCNAVIYVVNRDVNLKNDKDSDSVNDEPEQNLDADDTASDEDQILTRGSSTQHSLGTVTPPIDPMEMGLSGRPMHLGDDRNQVFQLPPSLSFDKPRQQCPYSHTSRVP